MSLKYLLAAASMAMLLGVGTSAKALETEFVERGTVSEFSDSTGNTFGENGASLDGASFVATFYINTGLGYLETYPGGEQVFGGSEVNVAGAVPVTASLEINGVTQSLSGSTLTLGAAGFGNGIIGAAVSTGPYAIAGDIDCNAGCSPSVLPTAFGQPFSVTTDSVAESGDSSFTLSTTFGRLDIQNVSSAALSGTTSAAPEPSSWLLMIAGVGLAGLMLRRRVRIDPWSRPVAAHV